MGRDRWWRQGRTRKGRYAPDLWPVWLVAPVWVIAASFMAWGIYHGLRAIVVSHPGPNGGPAVIDPLDVIKTTITIAGFVGAILVGVYGYRKQRLVEGDAHRADAEQLAQRYTTAAEALGHEKAAVRLAGVYAMGRLADDWVEQRQVCIDVLCAYLRMPYETDAASEKYREGEREVRLTIIRIIRDHLRDPGSPITWCSRYLDFTGATFDGGDFSHAKFTGPASFTFANFTNDLFSFFGAQFAADAISFYKTSLTGGTVDFGGTEFQSGVISFLGAKFAGGQVDFSKAKFSGSDVDFIEGDFSGGSVSFDRATCTSGKISFEGVKFGGSHMIWGPFKAPAAWIAQREK